MSLHNGYIQICENIEIKSQELKEQLQPNRVVLFIKDKFLVEDAKEVISEAYISEKDIKYIIIGAKEYNIYSQNSLLKIFEEPPKNIVFILLTLSKSSLIPTIRSRLPIKKEKIKKSQKEIDLDISKLDINHIFDFLQQNKYISKNDAKEIIEQIYKKSVSQNVKMTQEQLENFEIAYKLLELNSKPVNVLSMLLMGFLYAD
jgi:DNA polymerase-3 subunit delta'